MNIGYHSDFMDRIIERANKRNERTENEPMTNEEYLKSLDTKQLAKFLAEKFNEVVIAEWLKENHHGKNDM